MTGYNVKILPPTNKTCHRIFFFFKYAAPLWTVTHIRYLKYNWNQGARNQATHENLEKLSL